jgi:parallel beta-helix repeat protein
MHHRVTPSARTRAAQQPGTKRRPVHVAAALLSTLLASLALVIGTAGTAHAATFTVTNTADEGPGSLRQAIDEANFAAGADTIAFNIPGAGPHTITPQSDLPSLDGTTTIDGYTQPGAAPATATTPATIKIRLDGSGPSEFGLSFGAGGLLRGLSITNFYSAVDLYGTPPTTVTGNFIGWAADGTSPAANEYGISTASDGHVIGGTSPAERNVIASTTTGVYLISAGNLVEGNWIGTDATGTSTGFDGYEDVYIAGSGNIVRSNLITGTADSGVYVDTAATNTEISSNRIGTNVAGTAIVGDKVYGVYSVGTNTTVSQNVVGGAESGVNIAGGTATVAGNHVGASVDGTAPLPNETGILVDGAGNAQISQNGISNSSYAGIDVAESGRADVSGNTITGDPSGWSLVIRNSSAATIRENSISGAGMGVFDTANASIRKNSFTAVDFGIDLNGDGPTPNDALDADTGPNSLQNYPVLTGKVLGPSTTVTGTLGSTPNAFFALDFYANAAGTSYGEGQRWLGELIVTTNGAGIANFTTPGLGATSAGEEITATATNTDLQTSEFSISPPVAVADTATTNEDTAVDVFVLSDDTDVDSPNADLRVGSVTNVVGGTAQISGDGRSVNFVPAANASGTGFSFTYTAVDGTGAESAPANVTITVNEVAETTVTTVTSSANPSSFGQAVTFTATVTSDSGTPTGTVQFKVDGTNLGTPVALAGGTATSPSTSSLGVGTHTVTAEYSGAGFDPSSGSLIQTVNKASQTITFTSTAPTNPPVGGSYTVTATGGGSGNPVVFTSATPSTCTVSGSTVSFVGLGTCTINANQAGNANYDAAPQVTQTMTVVKASPTISTQASPGNLVGAPVRDTATLAGGFNPTGNVTFRLFSDAGCNAEVFSSTKNLPSPVTSDWFTPATAGTYRWIATYNGDANNNTVSGPCNAPNESETLAPFVAPAYTRTITGDFMGPVTVAAGESVLLNTGARVVGPVTVAPGGALTVTGAKITGGLTADNPSFLSICGTEIAAPSTGAQALGVSNAAVPIRIGDPANGCAGNRFAGTVSLATNLAVTFGANAVSHAATFTNGGPGNTVIKANDFLASLACTANTPAPVNAGQPNTAPSKTGQCTGI